MALSFLCEELMVEILSWLPVRSLMQCRCVSKSFKSLISDPSFVKLHLQRSPNNTNFLIRYRTPKHDFALPCSLRSLLEGPLSDIALKQEEKYKVAGSCNGLVLLFALSNTSSTRTYKFLLWNPAIRKTFQVPHYIIPINPNRYDFIKWFGFGTGVKGLCFLKGDIHGDKDVTTLRMITFIPFFIRRITNKDTFKSFGI
ncbi:putative F-box protein At1g47790 [Cajanus cajan]|uniref:putative F-box protein At1g47790 n=1 Tax=Cajanus cajan TaxID=3821 RepID=UPI00098DCDE5|nr:putative F-box protein At1g47790 [Cajanus cajan]